ncbi:MAG: hypothetical protein ACRDHB_02600 [Actinomycetota bacterium]
MGEPTEASAVWDMIRRADDLVKYAPNRDPATARAQARQQLEQAREAVESVGDRQVAEALSAQIHRRLHDLDRMTT